MKESHNREHFGGMREIAILRDGECCVRCGLHRQEHLSKYGRDITVDHIDGNGRNSLVKNNNLSNLQTLCLGCHGSKDARKLDEVKAVNIYHCRDNKKDARSLCVAYGVNIRAEIDIRLGKSWSSVTGVHRSRTPSQGRGPVTPKG